MAEDTTKFTVETDDLTGSLNKATKAIKEETAAAGNNSKIVKDNAQQIKNLSTAQKMTAGTAKTLGASMATANNVTNLFSESSGTLTGFMGNLIPVLGGITKGIKGITLAIKANPIGFVIASLMAIIALFNPIVNGIKKVANIITENFTADGRATKALRTFNAELDKQIVKAEEFGKAMDKALSQANNYYELSTKAMVSSMIESGASADAIEKAINDKRIKDNERMLNTLTKAHNDYQNTTEKLKKAIEEKLNSGHLKYMKTMNEYALRYEDQDLVNQMKYLNKKKASIEEGQEKETRLYKAHVIELNYSSSQARKSNLDAEKEAAEKNAKIAKSQRDKEIAAQRAHNTQQIKLLKEKNARIKQLYSELSESSSKVYSGLFSDNEWQSGKQNIEAVIDEEVKVQGTLYEQEIMMANGKKELTKAEIERKKSIEDFTRSYLSTAMYSSFREGNNVDYVANSKSSNILDKKGNPILDKKGLQKKDDELIKIADNLDCVYAGILKVTNAIQNNFDKAADKSSDKIEDLQIELSDYASALDEIVLDPTKTTKEGSNTIFKQSSDLYKDDVKKYWDKQKKIQDAYDKANEEIASHQKVYDDATKSNEAALAKSLEDIKLKYNEKILGSEDKNAKKELETEKQSEIEKTRTLAENSQANLDAYRKEQIVKDANSTKEIQNSKEAADAANKEQLALEKKKTTLSFVSDATSELGNISSAASQLMGENSKEQVAMNIATATASMASGMAKAISSASGIGFPQNLIAIAGSVATLLTYFAQIKQLTSESKDSYSKGGLVRGAGTGTSDSIQANVSNGESVINARSTAQYAPILSAINQANGGNAIGSAASSNRMAALTASYINMNPVVSVESINRQSKIYNSVNVE